MVKDSVVIQLASGLETRPIAMLVQVASQFESSIHLESGSRNVNAKSIMGMMTLGLDNGERVTITADGSDEEKALQSMKEYLTKDIRVLFLCHEPLLFFLYLRTALRKTKSRFPAVYSFASCWMAESAIRTSPCSRRNAS